MLSLAEFMNIVLLSAFASSPRAIHWWSSAPDFGRVGLILGGSAGRMGFTGLRVLTSLDLVIFLVQALSAGSGTEADELGELHNVMFDYCVWTEISPSRSIVLQFSIDSLGQLLM
ncbi:hypothetical protein N7494_006325 [Penicillium frequentans]|uniref:Uncharacterized protein n=1 Tax=Penicillium frequentans TaxID=3151616 RepID=A0AAD6CWF9_9EURO|nr:hypothetical protein N7494_006325 [Penicillium glabrum]